MEDLYRNLLSDKIHEKISESIIGMVASGDLPYYGEFAAFMNFHESVTVPTAGVNISKRGMNFYWNKKFFDSLIQSESNFLLLHEEMHLLFNHIKRAINYDHSSANIVQDMIINQIIYDEIMIEQGLGTLEVPFVTIPKDSKNQNSALMIPKDFKGEPIFEELYEWYMMKKRKWQKNNRDKINQLLQKQDDENDKNQDGENSGQGNPQSGQGNPQSGQGNPQSGQGNPQSGGDDDDENSRLPNHEGDTDISGKPKYGQYGQNDVECYSLDSIFENEELEKQNTLDVHLEDTIPEELKRQIVEGAMDALKSRGLNGADIEKIINKLRKKRKDYLKEIKKAMSNHLFGRLKSKSISRPNRRGISGLKGIKKYSSKINVILDTSGSMDNEFEKTLSYIFQNDIEINLIQCDTSVKQVVHIKEKRELEKMKIYGLGGTFIQPAIDFIADKQNKCYMYNTCILTDGWTDSLNFMNIKTKTLILSTCSKCPLEHDNGRVKQIENIGED